MKKKGAVPEGGSSGTAEAGGQATSYAPVMPLRPGERQFTDLVSTMRTVTKERRWLFEGAVEGTPIAVMAGPEKSAKSWALMQAAVACATRGSWLGAFRCARPGPVIYLDSEYGDFEFARRLARLCRGMGHDPEKVAPMIHHYYAVDLRLSVESDAANWVMKKAKAIGPRIIFVDPWRNAIDGDENSAGDTTDSMGVCSAFRDASGAAVMIAHHLNRAGTTNGSRALTTRADLLFEGSDEEEPSYKSRARTIRRADPICDRRFILVVDHDDDDDDTVAKTRVRLRFEGDNHAASGGPSKPALRILDALKNHRTAMSSRALRKASNIPNGDFFNKAVGELLSAKLVSKDTKGRLSMPTNEFFETFKTGADDAPF